uniref:Peptide deformylase n=1 Tax=Pseudo-nitzschia delicatissima TaxID=44447 RepID=A0A7S0TB91_9STRA|mmetsp:Transcript_2206/g.5221  ORF Transcript_2206/g.5221 Transcript_2206/m.5221 type:complete len:274 (+) Transcript_2206:140-961(+)
MTRRVSKRTTSLSFLFIFIMSISKLSSFARLSGNTGSLLPTASALVNGRYGSRSASASRLIATATKPSYQSSGILTSLFSSPPSKEEVDPGKVEGTDYTIVKYPHPSLRAENTEVVLPDEQDSITDIAKQMLKVMYAAQGVGLAAPQIGVNKRLMVYNPSGDSKKWLEETILVNPKITEYSDAKDEEIEGCLSFPDMQGEVVRSKWIKVEAMTPKGRKIKKKFKGWEARIFQHEYDHLDGTVYTDRLSDETKEKVQGRLNELIEEFDGDDAAP